MSAAKGFLTRRFNIAVTCARLDIADETRQPELYACITFIGLGDIGTQKKVLRTSISRNITPTWPDVFDEFVPFFFFFFFWLLLLFFIVIMYV